MIPRAVLFGSPERADPQLSPEGSQLLFLAPVDDVLAVWVQTVGRDDARVVVHDRARPIRIAFWSTDGTHVLYLQDAGGDENFHVFAVPAGGGDARDLTPFPGVLASVLALDDDHPDTLLVQMNRRDARLFDVYRLSLTDGTLVLDTENPGDIAGWEADEVLQVRAAVRAGADGTYAVLVRDETAQPWRTLIETAVEDGSPDTAGFTPDGRGLYVITSYQANAKRLLRYDLASGVPQVVLEDPAYDVSGVLRSRAKRDVIAAMIRAERGRWHVLDPSYADDFAALAAADPGDPSIRICDRDDARWVVTYANDAASTSYWRYDRATKRAEKLFDARPALAQYRLAPMEPVAFDARDGLRLHGYLTRPLERTNVPGPMVLVVHGGPWARDVWGYNPYAQLFVDRGYSVLQVNFRGSTGYGKAFLNAGDRQWAGTMRTDLLDAKAWAVEQGIADSARVAIFGGSYGGYAVLAALAFTPDAFACGVDIVGPSNLNTLLGSIPPYWHVLRGEFVRRMGEEEAFLASQSPLHRAEHMTAPLLIAQGANDPRVKIAESDQIVNAMRKNGREVSYAVFEDEGHGFARPDNNLRFVAATEAFLAAHLGGRFEPASAAEAIDAFLR